MAEISDKHIERFKKLISEANMSLIAAEELLMSVIGDKVKIGTAQNTQQVGKIIEGIFNGREMIADDGKAYPVQANYASKSRLVQGDRMKLTINDSGGFMFKQIGPIKRSQVVGVLDQKDGHFFVLVDNKTYQVLTASVTHHKVQPGDQISVSIPADDPDAEWAAIESPL